MKYGLIAENPLEWIALKARKVPIPVFDLLVGPLKARAIMTACSLGLFEALREGPRTSAQLAVTLEASEPGVESLLRTLLFSEYVCLATEGYELSNLGRETMLDGSVAELVGYARLSSTQWDMMSGLDELVKTGRGLDFHEQLDGEAWSFYQRAMLELARAAAPMMTKRVRVPNGATRLLDIGGSHGLTGAKLCRQHPPMRSTVVELPAAIEHARKLAAAEGFDDVVDHRALDITKEPLGEDFDVALLSNILHHFSAEDNRAIVARVRDAMRAGGTVAIFAFERPARGASGSLGDPLSLFFRLTSTAAIYHGDEYAEWLTAAGFTNAKVERPFVPPGTVLVTATAPGRAHGSTAGTQRTLGTG